MGRGSIHWPWRHESNYCGGGGPSGRRRQSVISRETAWQNLFTKQSLIPMVTSVLSSHSSVKHWLEWVLGKRRFKLSIKWLETDFNKECKNRTSVGRWDSYNNICIVGSINYIIQYKTSKQSARLQTIYVQHINKYLK